MFAATTISIPKEAAIKTQEDRHGESKCTAFQYQKKKKT